MGTYKPGAFGPFNGKIGDVVASRWKTINVVKNFPAKSKKPKTELQLNQTSQFSLVTNFLKKAAGLISVGYGGVKGSVTPMNAALKYHLAEAITGVYPNHQLDYSKVNLSLQDSKMDHTHSPVAEALANIVVKISWKIDANANKSTLPTDKAYILLYNPAKKNSVSLSGNMLRSALSAEVPVPSFYLGDVLHCWLFFASADGKIVSETSYLKTVTVIE